VNHEILWLDQPESHDFPAAHDYLTLHFDEEYATALVEALKGAEIVYRKAKDIVRASGLTLLGAENKHVTHNLKKIAGSVALSPLLLVRGDRLRIADGFHRLSAVHLLDEDALVPVKIV
jgi:hypothetical protein